MSENQTVELCVLVKNETPKAMQCEIDGKTVWLPKSQLTNVQISLHNNQGTLEVPEWLANKNELI